MHTCATPTGCGLRTVPPSQCAAMRGSRAFRGRSMAPIPEAAPDVTQKSSENTRGPKKRRPKVQEDELPELPMAQVQAMFQERMKALMMQATMISRPHSARQLGSQ